MEINLFKYLWTTRKAFILSVAAKCQFVPSRKTWSEWEKTELVLYISMLLQLFDLNPEPNTGILFCPEAVYNLTGSATLSKTKENKARSRINWHSRDQSCGALSPSRLKCTGSGYGLMLYDLGGAVLRQFL